MIAAGLAVGGAAVIGVLKVHWGMIWLLPIGGTMGAAGTWHFARPAPRPAGGRYGRELCAALRVASVATATLQFQDTLFAVPTRYSAFARAWLPWLAAPMVLVWAAGAAMTCLRAARLAREVGDASGAVQARLLSVLAPATLGLYAYISTSPVAGNLGRDAWVLLAVLGCAVAGWSAVFFAGFAVVLQRRAGGFRGGVEEIAAPPAVAI